jgi:acetyltransferase
LHKTERGLVHLNLLNAAAVEKAFQSIRRKEKETPVLVCEMVEGERELMVGMKGFSKAPPCIVFGLGGIFAEAFQNHRLRVAPLSRADALSMIESPSFSKILGNFRGMTAVDKEALSSILIQLGHLALHFPQIKEIDLNPVIIGKDGLPKVVDALIIRDS